MDITIICAGCGKSFEIFKEGDSRLCYNCSRRESLEDHDWFPSYVDEPCRICGKTITVNDLREIVWAGYSSNNEARSAHKECWDMYPSTRENGPHPMWVYQ